MSDENTTDDTTTDDAAEAPAWTAPEGHTTLLSEAIRDTASSPLVWDESLPANGIVEHNAPGEFVNSLQYSTDVPAEVTEPEPAPTAPSKKAPPAKKAAATKAPAKKAAAKKAGAKAAT